MSKSQNVSKSQNGNKSKKTDGPSAPQRALNEISSLRQAQIKGVEDGSNQKYIKAILMTREIAKNADTNNLDTLYDCLHRYLQFCFENNVKVTNMSCYSAMGLDRATLSKWESGALRGSDPRYAEFARYVRHVCAEYREMLMSDGKLNPVTGIWWQKNYDGLTDSPTVIVAARDDTPRLSGAEIAEKYKYLAEQNETSENK